MKNPFVRERTVERVEYVAIPPTLAQAFGMIDGVLDRAKSGDVEVARAAHYELNRIRLIVGRITSLDR